MLDRHEARVLGRWRERLRALPPSSALATPDFLMPLMAPAFALVRREAMPPAAGDETTEEPPQCRCGLNPLVAFYLTGECATFDVLWAQPDALAPLARADREAICRNLTRAWHRVAAAEISLFCGACQRGAALAAEDAAQLINASTSNDDPPARGRPWATARRPAETRG